MNISRYLCCAAASLGLLACSSSSDDTAGATAAATTTATPATTTSSLVLTVEGPPTKPGIDARVKAEVDRRTDGITGSTWSIPGARASLQSPKDWATTKGDVTVIASPDKKAQLAGTSFGTEGPEPKLDTVTKALGLTDCDWNPAESLVIGKSNVNGSGADGRCMRGTTPIKMAYVSGRGEALLVVGAWEADGDSASVFGAMRSITRPTGGGGAGGLGPCCAALRQNAASAATPDQKNAMLQAAAICDGARNNPQTAAVIGQIRGMLRGANMPSSCQ